MESDSVMDSDSDAEAPEKRIMSYMYLFEAKINYYHRDWDATSYMRRYLDLRRYKLKQPELIAFAAIDQEPPDDDTANTSNKSLSVTGIICGYGIRYAAVLKYLARMEGSCRARRGEDSEARKNSIMPGSVPKKSYYASVSLPSELSRTTVMGVLSKYSFRNLATVSMWMV